MQKNTNNLGIVLIGILFFIFGFITWSTAQLITYLKIACQVTDTQSYLVATAFFAAYFFTSYPSSIILKKIGFKKGMSLGLLIMAVGAFLFVPAAMAISFAGFLTAQFIIGTGLAMLQTAVNPYVTILGPIESAARRMSIMGICNKLAGIISVYVLGKLVLDNAEGVNEEIKAASGTAKELLEQAVASKVIMPYVVIGLALVVLAVILNKVMPEAHINEKEDLEKTELDGAVNASVAVKYNERKSIWKLKHLMLGALAIFFYVGVESLSIDTFSTYGQAIGFSLDEAKNFATYTGYGMLLGYFVGIVVIPSVLSQRKALVVSCLLSMFFVCLIVLLPQLKPIGDEVDSLFWQYTPVISFALLGFSNAAIWPAIWPLALKDVGSHTEQGSALLVMGIVGGAILPPLYGVLSDCLKDKIDAYWIMIPCYLFILYFAIWGSKQKSPSI